MLELNPQRKKQLGVYYTPAPVSELMTRWAVRSQAETVLEPSFGGCCFIEAIRSRLMELGATDPNDSIFGCDIDEDAFEHYLPRAMEFGVPSNQFYEGDFLTQSPGKSILPTVDVVIGNPPYVSNHNMSHEQRLSSREVSSFRGFNLSGLASLWAYFVLHGMRFLKPGGRMAWLLPGSATQSDYGRDLIRFVGRCFDRVEVITLSERIFREEGAQESSEILICDCFTDSKPTASISSSFVENIGGLSDELDRQRTAALPRGEAQSHDLYEALISLPTVSRLGDIADVKIGLVTGDNSFFILNEDQARVHRLPKSSLHRVFSNSKIAKGLSLKETDLELAEERGDKVYMLRPTSRSKYLDSYYESYDAEKRGKVRTFKKRLDWRDPEDGAVPDAFFVYMSQGSPRLVLNQVRSNSTNSIHRVYFVEDLSEKDQMLASLSLVSSLGRLSAEIEGRKYGGGLLKHEPSDVRSLVVFKGVRCDVRTVRRTFSEVSALVAEGRNLEATDVVDEFFARTGGSGVSIGEMSRCRELYSELINRRLRRKSYGNE